MFLRKPNLLTIYRMYYSYLWVSTLLGSKSIEQNTNSFYKIGYLVTTHFTNSVNFSLLNG